MSADQLEKASLAGFPALRIGGRRDRPPLFFIHGAFVTHEPFAAWMEFLAAAGWRSVAAARRGRLGVGPDRAEGVTVADYVEDTRRAVEALGEAPILVGHSLGGLIAQKIAEMGLCRGMVLLAPAPPAMLTAQPVAVPAYLRMLPRILAGRPLVPACGVCSTIALDCVPEADGWRQSSPRGLGRWQWPRWLGKGAPAPCQVRSPTQPRGHGAGAPLPTLQRYSAATAGAGLRSSCARRARLSRSATTKASSIAWSALRRGSQKV